MRQRPAVARPFWVALAMRIRYEQLLRVAKVAGYDPHEAQEQFHRCRARYRVLACGRRWGKSMAAAIEALTVALLGGHVLLVGPTFDLASVVWDKVLDLIYQSEFRHVAYGLKTAAGKQEVSFTSGGRIYLRSSDSPKGLLGRAPDLIVFDEAAQEADPLVWLQYISPSLADHEGAAIFISTPRGDDWFKDLFDLGQRTKGQYRSWQFPSRTNTKLATVAGEAEKARADLPQAVYLQEWEADFGESTGAVFKKVSLAATAKWQPGPAPGHSYVLGVDVAQVEDFTVVMVFDLTMQEFVHFERFNQISYTLQEARVVELSRVWGAPVLIDATNNYSVYEKVAEAVDWASVEPYVFTQAGKRQVVSQLAVAVEKHEVALLARDQEGDEESDLARAAFSEMGSYRYQKTAAGNITMNAPSGKHDDIVTASCLAFEMSLRAVGGIPVVASTSPRAGGVRPISGKFGRQVGGMSSKGRRTGR